MYLSIKVQQQYKKVQNTARTKVMVCNGKNLWRKLLLSVQLALIKFLYASFNLIIIFFARISCESFRGRACENEPTQWQMGVECPI